MEGDDWLDFIRADIAVPVTTFLASIRVASSVVSGMEESLSVLLGLGKLHIVISNENKANASSRLRAFDHIKGLILSQGKKKKNKSLTGAFF